jgi:hypothetical protein
VTAAAGAGQFEQQENVGESRTLHFQDAANVAATQHRARVPGGRPIAVGSPPVDADSAASGNPWKSTHATAGEVAP